MDHLQFIAKYNNRTVPESCSLQHAHLSKIAGGIQVAEVSGTGSVQLKEL